MPNIFGLILTCVIVVIVFSLLLFLIKRYKKCPSDKVMVIYGQQQGRLHPQCQVHPRRRGLYLAGHPVL